jgi:hypothetical protein
VGEHGVEHLFGRRHCANHCASWAFGDGRIRQECLHDIWRVYRQLRPCTADHLCFKHACSQEEWSDEYKAYEALLGHESDTCRHNRLEDVLMCRGSCDSRRAHFNLTVTR